MKTAWILAGALSLGSVVSIPGYAQAQHSGHEARAAADAADAEHDVDWKDLPQAVQDAIRKATNDRKVQRVIAYQVHGNTHYHALVRDGDDVQTVVLDDKGNVSNVSTTVDYGSLPGDVKGAIGREAGSGKVENDVEKVTRERHTYYVATVNERDGNDKVIRVDSDGKVISEKYEDDGRLASERVRREDVRAERSDVKREAMDFNDLPGDVKGAIGREAKSDHVRRVDRLTKSDGKVTYRATVGGKDESNDRVIIVDPSGKVLVDKDLDDWLDQSAKHHN